MKKKFIVITAAVLIALAFGFGTYYYNAQQAKEISQFVNEENSVYNRPNSPSLGSESAKVQIVEFFDPACESCRMMYPHVKTLMKNNAGKVRLTLRYTTFHDGSNYVAKVLEAARMQGPDIYWKSLEAILEAQPVWAQHDRPNPQRVWEFLGPTGLDIQKAKQDMNHPSIAALLKQDSADLTALKVTQTPSFFINGKPLTEFGPGGLNSQVDSEISAAYK